MTDGLFTGSTSNQRQVMNHEQPYPAEQPAASTVQTAPVASAGQVSRGSLPPVASARSAVTDQVAVQRQNVSTRIDAVEQTANTQVQRATAPVAAAQDNIKGWSRAGGTQVTAKEGETVYNLSRRFGVPADVIMQMNGISADKGLQVGQNVVIPTYVYTAKAGVSAPDNDPKTAQAKSSRGTLPADTPKSTSESQNLAVLPTSPKLKDPTKVASASGASNSATSDGTYTVVAGDSLSKISRKTGVSVAALKSANGLSHGNIKIGQTLSLKPGASVVAKSPAVDESVKTASIPAAEKTPSAAKVNEYTPPKKAVEDAARESDAVAPESTGIGRMRWPVRGKVVSGYGSRNGTRNDGIDISVPSGTPVKAAENGVVIYAGNGLKEFGNTVLVRHDNGLVTVYGHASTLKVQRGQKVKRGEEIAESGMSGNAKSPQLHFEVRKDSSPVDPSTYLE
ncbi:MAG: peptidoglycan DD-metalloendopeptidase family protein [Rhizobiaceae bacterium]